MNDKNNRVHNLFIEKVKYLRNVVGQFVCVESKQLCRDINIALKIKEKILLIT
jgi:hypothetical protein